MNNGKQQQREILRQNIENLSLIDKTYFSRLIGQNLFDVLQIRTATTVLSYLATNKEVNLDEVNALMEKMGKVVAYPICGEDDMQGYISRQKGYLLNRYGIREPDKAYSMMMDKDAFDVVIVPLLGFDENCGRIGHGGGFYDRYLQDCPAFKIGVGFEAQKLKNIIMEENDIYMDCIVTEQNIYHRIIGE